MNYKLVTIVTVLTVLIQAGAALADAAGDKAVADVVRAQTKLHALKSVTANIAITMSQGGKTTVEKGTVKCLKPNYIWLDTRVPPSKGQPAAHHIHISDGKDYCSPDAKGRWTSVKAAPDGANFRQDLFIWSDFYKLYATDNAKRLFDGADVTIDSQSIGGKPYEVITSRRTSPQPMTQTVYIASDGLIHRMAIAGGPMRVDMSLTNLRTNAQLKVKDFQPHY